MTGGPKSTNINLLRKNHSNAVYELDRYKLLVDSIQDYAIFLMDKDGYIMTWNKGAEKNKGYKPDEIIGKHFSVFYQKEDKEARKPEREIEIAMQFGRAEDEDWRVRKDGSLFWASVVLTALHDSKGELVGFAKVTRDLTERKQHEDELRRANVILKAQQRELESLNQSKDEFISLASHQLRTPATAIKQLLGLYIEGFITDLPEQHLALIAKAYESNERQINIVNSLLKVAQIDSGKIVLSNYETDICAMLHSIVNDFTDSFSKRMQEVNFKNDPGKVTAMVDEQYLRMALENIVSNASKYTPKCGRIIFGVTENKSVVVVTIKDSGVGIASKDLALLFEKFKRIPNDLSDEVGGTGLGLYWSKKVIELHGGKIEVDSQPGVGTEFKILIPKGNIENA